MEISSMNAIPLKRRLETLCLAVVTLSLVGAVIGVFALLVVTKHEMRELRQREQQLLALQNEERDSINVLKVEIAYLTRPERIEDLARRHLRSQPAEPDAIYSLDRFIAEETPFVINPETAPR
ncbi:MAG: cell division protein FtsL [Alphaproteobacteria bacterium]|nr:cell division protein FtsL [Alphaproteobacteria bacterium]MDA7982857.1 cell division protein FtsL [Alphaproteobacteria bacterium]MDA7986987.1 cell division protein FtsL [Alphaproteobacteria bacterium]MDA8004803.1 cell division protein FtsL [Alphaproteobacteria bacterium]